MFCFGSVVSENLCAMFCETKICSELRSLLTPFKKRTLRGRLYSFLQLALLAVKSII